MGFITRAGHRYGYRLPVYDPLTRRLAALCDRSAAEHHRSSLLSPSTATITLATPALQQQHNGPNSPSSCSKSAPPVCLAYHSQLTRCHHPPLLPRRLTYRSALSPSSFRLRHLTVLAPSFLPFSPSRYPAPFLPPSRLVSSRLVRHLANLSSALPPCQLVVCPAALWSG